MFWDVLLDAIIDTAKILPLLFIVYYLIELIEYKWAINFQNNKLLKGKASPVVGSLIGCVPQCGFSVISTDLFSKNSISVGALIAVYIATSDEAIPIMFSKPSLIPWMLLLIGIKIVAGIGFGYLAILLYKLIFKNKNKVEEVPEKEHEENEHVDLIEHGGCCHHHVETKSFDWLHPLLHCLKISAFILIINIIFGCVTEIWIGEENLTNFLNSSIYFQPLFAVLIGLIPNCASSVVLAELFTIGGLSFGALIAGLCVNAGLGLVVLLKQNKNWKQNLFIILTLISSGLILGYLTNFIISLF